MKNNMVIGLEDGLIKFQGATHEGSKHDKRIADEEVISFPEGTPLLGDLGFQGYQPEGAEVVLPFKKPRGKELEEGKKAFNTLLSSYRVRVEHAIASVKRLRIVKDVFRNFNHEMRNTVFRIACGFHNFRTILRRNSLKELVKSGRVQPVA